MKSFQITASGESISLTRQGALLGKLVVSFGDTFFPDSNWNDFIVVLAQWIEMAARMTNTSTEMARFGFMEGPYQVEALRTGPEAWLLVGKDRARNRELGRCENVSTSEVITAIRSGDIFSGPSTAGGCFG